MALSVAFPPMSTMHADPIMSGLSDTCNPFPLSCGFEPGLTLIKTEPVSVEEAMDTTWSYLSSSYTELSSANFSHIKQGTTDMYRENSGPQALASWTQIHPEHWEAREVLDWVFSLTDAENFDGALFRGEAYNSLTGKQLCAMTLADFLALDRHYGARMHEIFHCMLQDANFKKPCPPETFKSETPGGNVPHFAFLECPSDVSQLRPPQVTSPPANDISLSVFLDKNGNDMKVSLDGLGTYDIDVKQIFDNIDDSDYNSGSDADLDHRSSVSSDVFEPNFSDGEESTDVLPDLTRKTHSPSCSSDSGTEGDEERPHAAASSRRRPPSTSKGNHLWEFVRDLLKDPRFNPSLLKWEDKEMGVFKFVQSEAVAQMWGRKKNNPGMTYEKLSRAMRFCRSAGYFASVPKTGRFPKKLCFQFGEKAHSWRE